VPLPLAAIIARCLEKSPAERFPSAFELEAALAVLDIQQDLAAPRRRRKAIAAAAVGVVALSGLALALHARSSPPPAAPVTVAAADKRPEGPARVQVAIGSEPEGAEVFEDQVMLGVTPCSVRLLPGRHLLSLLRDGYAPTPLEVDARAGGSASARLRGSDAMQQRARADRPQVVRHRATALPPDETLDPFH
jgi:hypothetical protein